MNSKVTLGLLAAALAAVGFVVWYDRDRPGTQASAAAHRKVLPAAERNGKATPINRVEILGPEGKTVLALDGARAWQVLAPIADRANPAAIRELIEALETSLKIEALPAAGDLDRYGLREPACRLKIFRAGEAPVELELGARTAVEGRIYARIAGAPEIMVIPESIELLARRPADQFRDPRLLGLRPAEIARISIRNQWGSSSWSVIAAAGS